MLSSRFHSAWHEHLILGREGYQFSNSRELDSILRQAFMRQLIQLLRYLWASPTTLVATTVALVGVPFGTRLRFRRGTVEAYGGLVNWLLKRTPISAAAMTLGHMIWGRCPETLDLCRDHELVHVRQYERWGPLFLPMYLGFSLQLWLQGRHPYYENPFEKEAYGIIDSGANDDQSIS